jgi:hypothetical protein
MNLALEFVAGTLEFGHELTPGPGEFRQLLGPKQNERQNHNEEDLARKAEVHSVIA